MTNEHDEWQKHAQNTNFLRNAKDLKNRNHQDIYVCKTRILNLNAKFQPYSSIMKAEIERWKEKKLKNSKLANETLLL